MRTNRFLEWTDSFEASTTMEVAPQPRPVTAFQSDHLLKVAGAVTQDATQVWMELWSEFKDHVSPSGAAMPDMAKGFVPACGWGAFLEKFWLLKHHLDSASRVCKSH
jgi:hypothetical protein